MRTERWWYLLGFLFLSVLVHVFLALHGPGFGLKGEAPSAKEIELTLEPLPPDKKPNPPTRKPQMAARPKPQAKPQPKVVKEPQKVAEKPRLQPKVTPKPLPKVAVKPLEEKPTVQPVTRPVPQVQIAKAAPTPTVKPAVSHVARTVAPETPEQTTQPVKTASITPHFSPSHSSLTMENPLSGLTTPDDRPQSSAAHSDAPRLTQTASARAGLSGGASGGGHGVSHGPQMPTDLPQANGLPGGMHFPRMASRIGGESIMSVKNPLAEDAVPEEKPGFSAGSGGHPGLGVGGGSGGLHGIMLAARLTGHGSGYGGGIGGGHGAGSGHGSGSGQGSGHGTGAGHSGSGDGSGIDLPGAVGDGYGRMGIGFGPGAGGTGHGPGGGGLRVASLGGGGGGGAFGNVSGLLRGEPPRTPGDGQPGTNGHGLSTEIYQGQPYLTFLAQRRTDAKIDFDWGMTVAVAQGVNRIFSVRWTGKIQPKYSETYTFSSQEDDGLRLWVDGQLLINDWRDHKLTSRQASIPLEAGRKYDIRIEYFNGPQHAHDSTGRAAARLRWTSPSQPLEIIPESAFWQN